MEAFHAEAITSNIIRIKDCMDVAMYLVIGEDRACLLDTGTGLGNLAEYCKAFTQKPIFVILTHGHLDHAGGANQFQEVYMNEKELEVYQTHQTISFRKSMFTQSFGMNEPIDDVVRKEPFLPLEDGQTFDLGGISVTAIQVAGHTPGMMMVLIPEARIMLFGDACGVNVMLFEDWSSCVSQYKENLLHIKVAYENCYDRVIRNHGTFESPCEILDEVIECCEDILAKRDDHIPTTIFCAQGFYRAKAVDERGNRIDGNTGNVVYRFDKGC